MTDPTQTTAQFQAALAETPLAWRSVDVRAAGVRRGDAWHNLLTVARLDHRPASERPAPEILAETPSMIAIRTAMPREALTELVDQVLRGAIVIADRTIRFASLSRGAIPGPYENAFLRMATAFEDQLDVGPTLIGHEMVLSGDNVWNVLDSIRGGRDQLSQELRAAQEPWDGFEALMYHGLGTRRRLEHEAVQFCVRAPLPVRFRPDHLRLSRGNLSFALETTDPALLPYCTVGYVSTVHGAIGKRATVAPDHETRWASAEGSVTWACNQEVTDAERVAIFARVGPYVVDRTTVVDERLRVQRALVSAYETVDPELELLGGRLLKPQKSEQVEFERALARVLLFCGFAVDSFAGDSRLSDAIDIVAHAPTTKVLLAVECTTGPLQSRDGKLSRLVARTQAIANRIAPDDGSISHTTVIPVIATSLEEVSISDMASARADGVRVLTHQALVELLEIARTGAGPDAVLALLREGSSDGRGRVSDIPRRSGVI